MLKATIPVVAVLLLVPAPATQARRREQLATTAHQPLPANTSDLWLVPSAADVTPAALTPFKPLIDGAAAFRERRLRGRLAARQPGRRWRRPSLRDYAAYYTAASQLRLSRSAEARARFHALRERKPQGTCRSAAALGEAEAAEALGDYKAAIDIYDASRRLEDDGQRRRAVAPGARRIWPPASKKKAAEAFCASTTSSR